MPGSLRREPDGVAVALVIYLSLCCAVAAFFALVMYYLMQPTRFPNPGMAAHTSSPATVSYLELLRSEREAAQRAVKFKVEPETTGAVTREAEPYASSASTRTAARHDALRAATVVQRLPADVLRVAATREAAMAAFVKR